MEGAKGHVVPVGATHSSPSPALRAAFVPNVVPDGRAVGRNDEKGGRAWGASPPSARASERNAAP